MQPGKRDRDDTIGLVALIAGIASIPMVLCFILGVPLGILAIVLGQIGKRRADRGLAGNRGQAVTGMLCGSVGLFLAAIAIILPDG